MMRLPTKRMLADQEHRVVRGRRDARVHLRRAREAARDQASRPGSLAAAFALGGMLGWTRPASARSSAGAVRRPVLGAMLSGGLQLGLRVLPYLLWRVRFRRSHHDDAAADLSPPD
jgi:hypothetical protein